MVNVLSPNVCKFSALTRILYRSACAPRHQRCILRSIWAAEPNATPVLLYLPGRVAEVRCLLSVVTRLIEDVVSVSPHSLTLE